MGLRFRLKHLFQNVIARIFRGGHMSDRYWLPDELLAEIGRVSTISAYIEQEIILWASALAAQDTGGDPIEKLRMDFKRLRVKWYDLAFRKNDEYVVNKFIHPLNSDLSKVWPIRGAIIHGRWSEIGENDEKLYRIKWWEQIDQLKELQIDITLKEVKWFADSLLKILQQLFSFHEDEIAKRVPKSYVPLTGNLPIPRTIPKEHRWFEREPEDKS
jgi:hypothetical protein